ncbi:MAG: phosphomannomutase/phosphoglucomutase [Pseudomonadota bacterium]
MARSQPRKAGKLTRFPLTAALIGLAGLMGAFALLYFSVFAQANDSVGRTVANNQVDLVAANINSRYRELRTVLQRMADTGTARAAAGGDVGASASLVSDVYNAFPLARRVDVIQAGRAAVDRDAEVPISFAALDLIRRAEKAPFVGPEAAVKPKGVVFAAAAIENEGDTAGVLFVGMALDWLLGGSANDPALYGRLQLHQAMESGAPNILLDVGSGDEPGEAAPSRDLDIPGWRIVVAPGSGAAVTAPLDLALPAGIGVVGLLAGIAIAYMRLQASLTADARLLGDQASKLLRGRASVPDRYRLQLFQDLAGRVHEASGGKAAARAAEAEPPAAVPAKVNADPAEAGESTAAETNAALTEPAVEEEDGLGITPAMLPDDNFGIDVSEGASPVDMGMSLDPTIFRAYDVRGVVGKTLSDEVAYWLGRAYASEYLDGAQDDAPGTVMVGRDGRLTSTALAVNLCRGLSEGGLTVMDVGQVATPMLYFASQVMGSGNGIMVTGSHNPPEYNGFKLMLRGDTLAEERIQALHRRLVDNDLSEESDTPGDITAISIDADYIDRISSDIALAQSLKVVVDCGNGVAGDFAPALLTALGCEVIPLYCDVDGNFPNHHPDPAVPANLEDLVTVVEAEQADLGLAFDGDGDRLGVVTDRGEIVPADRLLMLFARDIVSRNPGADVIFDVKCSRHLNTLVAENGGRPVMWKTGHAHMKAKLKETGALLAGEFSGHIAFGERWYGFDDALYAAARLLEILAADAERPAELFAALPQSVSTDEITIDTTDAEKFDIVERFRDNGDWGAGTVTDIDGVRVDFEYGWGLLRASNTAPKLTLRFEADTESSLQVVQTVFRSQLAAVDSSLTF